MNTSCNKTKFTTAVTLSALLLSATLSPAAPPKEGEVFPDLSHCGLEGNVPSLKGKVVLVDFFASWCEPCKESFPAMEALYQKYHDKGLVIVAVNLDKNRSDMEDFLKKHPATFVVVRDASNRLVSQVKIPTMPSSFLLDGTGKVRAFHRGFKGDETSKEYAQEIETLLK